MCDNHEVLVDEKRKSMDIKEGPSKRRGIRNTKKKEDIIKLIFKETRGTNKKVVQEIHGSTCMDTNEFAKKRKKRIMPTCKIKLLIEQMTNLKNFFE
mgnify:CR=1 FL=1